MRMRATLDPVRCADYFDVSCVRVLCFNLCVVDVFVMFRSFFDFVVI